MASSSLGVAPDRVLLEAPDQLFVRADPQQLRSAIANVVRNALMYSPADSKVRVRVESENRSARVVVRDRGAGIPPEERETVFDPFSRGRAGGYSRSGSGLGLFIARRVLEAHGGSISLRPSKAGSDVRARDAGGGVAAIRVLIVDDHKLFADAISPALQRQGIGCRRGDRSERGGCVEGRAS